jgi:LTXXQ motif family protein
MYHAFAGRGWRGGYGNGWGWGGPVFWPYYYGDALSFALWPGAYDDPFFDYGPDDLFAGLFSPGNDYGYGAYPSDDIFGGDYYARAPRRSQRHEKAGMSALADACTTYASGIANLPVARIQKAIQPSAAAITKADSMMSAACPRQPPLTPVSRVAAIAQRLDATKAALDVIQPPLTNLYNSLGDEQKKKFDAIALGRRHRAQKNIDLVAQCKERSRQFTNLPVQQIADTLKPVGDQMMALDTLKTATDKAAAAVEDSCPAEAPQNITARFNAIDVRLKAMSAALKTIAPELKDFYATLSDEQKAQFNLMTAPAAPASGRG